MRLVNCLLFSVLQKDRMLVFDLSMMILMQKVVQPGTRLSWMLKMLILNMLPQEILLQMVVILK